MQQPLRKRKSNNTSIKVRRINRNSLPPHRERLYKKFETKTGKTLVHRIKNIPVPNNNQIFAIEGWKNVTGSLFDRIYLHLFKVAEQKGYIVPDVTPIIEASTGNAGAAFAWCAKQLGYKDCTVITHADTPKARIKQIESYGAKVILSPKGQYAKGYVEMLEDILRKDKEQTGGKIGKNPRRMYCVTKINPEAKVPLRKLVFEVASKLGKKKVDYFICVVGSGTTISGIGETLKEIYPKIKVIALEHESTDALSKLKKGEIFNAEQLPHKLYASTPFGLPAEKLDINFDIIDQIRKVSDNDWKNGMRKLEKAENKPVGRSSGASLSVALQIANEVVGKNILIVFFDPKWKYSADYHGMK
ncbi:MAG: pyridoxal-phosphate dependent enzyme [archaeon]|nr:pyridoxal-phosphate dependent enzyme [archaeon]